MNDDIKDLMQQGIDLMAVHNHQAAAEVFKKILGSDPQNVEAHLHLGNACANLGDYDSAISLFKKGLVLDSECIDLHYALGCSYFIKNKPVDALKCFNKCEDMGYSSVDMYTIVAALYTASKEYSQAVRYVNRAIALEPLNPEPRLDKARLFIMDRRVGEAIATLEETRRLLPDLADPYSVEAELYANQGDYGAALSVIDAAIKRFPQDPEMLAQKVRILNGCERYREAEPLIPQIDELIKGDEEAEKKFSLIKSVTYAGLEKVDESMETLRQRMDMGDDAKESSLFALMNEAMVLERYGLMEQYSAQLMAMENSQARFRGAAHFWHIQALKKLGREEEAQAEAREAVGILRKMSIENPGMFDIYSYRALVHAEIGDFGKAHSLIDHVIALVPNMAECYNLKANIYEMEGKAEEAENLRAKADKMDFEAK